MKPVSLRTVDSDPTLEAVQANLRMSGPDPAEIASLAAAGQAKAGQQIMSVLACLMASQEPSTSHSSAPAATPAAGPSAEGVIKMVGSIGEVLKKVGAKAAVAPAAKETAKTMPAPAPSEAASPVPPTGNQPTGTETTTPTTPPPSATSTP